jgi:hypothetical protein
VRSINLIGRRDACPLGEAARAATRRSPRRRARRGVQSHGRLLPTASADHTTRLWNLRFTSGVTQGWKVVNRNLSMTEWNELLVEVLPIKEAAGAYASETELQETLQPPTDLPTLAGSCGHGGERRHSPRKPGNSRMGPTAQASAGGLRLMCRFRQDDRAWFHHLQRRVRRVKAVVEAKS